MPLPPDDIVQMIPWLAREKAEQERRNRNRNRIGVITEVDPARGRARVRLGETGDRPFVTGWIPWQEQSAGTARTHWPPTIGQQVRVQSESGDLTDAEIVISMPSDARPRPSQKGDERVLLDVGPERSFSDFDGMHYQHEIDTMSRSPGSDPGKSYYFIKPLEVFLRSLDPGRNSWIRIQPWGITTSGGGLASGGGSSDSYSERRHTVRVRDEPYPYSSPDDPYPIEGDQPQMSARMSYSWDGCEWRWKRTETQESVICMLPAKLHAWVHDEVRNDRSDIEMKPKSVAIHVGAARIDIDPDVDTIDIRIGEDTFLRMTPGDIHFYAARIHAEGRFFFRDRELESVIAELKAYLDEHKGTIGSLTTVIEHHEDEIASLKDALEVLKSPDA